MSQAYVDRTGTVVRVSLRGRRAIIALERSHVDLPKTNVLSSFKELTAPRQSHAQRRGAIVDLWPRLSRMFIAAGRSHDYGSSTVVRWSPRRNRTLLAPGLSYIYRRGTIERLSPRDGKGSQQIPFPGSRKSLSNPSISGALQHSKPRTCQ